MYAFRNGDSRSGEWDCGVLKGPHPATDLVIQRAVQVVHVCQLHAASPCVQASNKRQLISVCFSRLPERLLRMQFLFLVLKNK